MGLQCSWLKRLYTSPENPPKPQHPNPHGLPDTQYCGPELAIEQSLLDPGARKMEDHSHKPLLILNPNKPYTHKHLPLQVHQHSIKHSPLQVCPPQPNHRPQPKHPPQITTSRKAPLNHTGKYLPHPFTVWHLQTKKRNSKIPPIPWQLCPLLPT